MVNELSGQRFPCTQFVPAYPEASPSERACSTLGGMPGDDWIDGDIYMNGNFEYHKSHLWRYKTIFDGSLDLLMLMKTAL